ncbi:bacteriohemerythrin [Azospirillum sp. sgz301742]
MSTFHPIAWTSDLAVGVPEIDDEHALLVTLYNDVVRAANQGVSRQMRESILRSLRAYAVFHMDHEDLWMRRHGYPDAEQHRQRHAEFKAAIDTLCAASDEQGTGEHGSMQIMAGFLRGWILGHIRVEDRALFDWMTGERSDLLAYAAE